MVTKVWTGTSGDWSVGTLWTPAGAPAIGDSAVIGGAATYVVTIGELSNTLETAGTLAISDAHAVLNIVSGSTLSVPGTISLTSGELELTGGTLSGATLLLNGGSFASTGATLLGVTIDGSLDAGSGLTVGGGLGFASPGGGPGTLSLGNFDTDVNFLDTETLNNAVILATGYSPTISNAGVLTLGATSTLSVSNQQGGVLDLTGSFVNSGTINVAADDVLEVTGGDFTNNGGALHFGPGSALLVDGGTSAQLLALASLVAGQGVQLELTGTLNNTAGGPLNLASGPLIGLDFAAGAEVLGGTLVAPPGSLLGSPTLSGVTVLGPLSLSQVGQDVSILAGTTFLSASGGAGGAINFTAADAALSVLDNETINNLQISVAAGSEGEDEIVSSGTSLAFGPNVLVSVAEASQTEFGGQNALVISAPTLVNQGTFSVGQTGTSLIEVQGTSFTNSGTLAIGTGGRLLVQSTNFTDTGPIALAAGGQLGLGGSLTTAQLNVLAGAISGSGGTIGLYGTLNDVGAVLNASGELGTLLVNGTISGGSIVAPVGSDVLFAGGSLIGLTYDGQLNVPGSFDALTLAGVTFAGAGGTGQGSIAVNGSYDTVTVLGGALDNVTIGVTSSNFAINASPSLVLGPHIALTTAGSTSLTATSISNAGNIVATGTAGAVFLNANTIVNTGTVAVASQGTLGLGVAGASALLALSNSGAISVASGGTLYVGARETTATLLPLLGGIIAPGSVTVELDGTLNNAAGSIAVGPGSLIGNLVLAGDIVGGTIATAGGTVSGGRGTLDGVTFLGPLNVSTGFINTQILDGITLDQVGGAAGGTLLVTGFNDTFSIGSLSLPSGTIDLFGGGDVFGSSNGTLALGAGVAVFSRGGSNTITAATLTNGGSIAVTGSGNRLDLATSTLVNTGVITVAAGDALGIGTNLGSTQTLAVTNTGLISINHLGTLVLGDSFATLTPAVLSALTAGDTGITVELFGTLENAGAVINVGSAVQIGTLDLLGDVVGGTIVGGPGSTINPGGTLTGVTYDGVLSLGGFDQSVDVSGGLTLNTAAGAAGGTLAAVGEDDSLTILDNETLNNIVLNVSDSNFVVDASTLGLGGNVTANVTGGLIFEAGAITTAATIALTSPGATLNLEALTIANSGIISIGSGDVLGIDYPGFITGPLAFSNTGQISVAAGGTIELGGTYTPAQLAAVAAFGGPSVEVVLGGTLLNTGNDLVAAGPLDDLVLRGVVQGGTINTGTGTVVVAGGTLANVIYQGTLVLAPQADLEVVGGLTLENTAGGLPGALSSAGGGNVVFYGAGSLDNALVLQSGASSLGISANGSLGLGSNLTIANTGAVSFNATTVSNAGTLLASGRGGDLTFYSGSIINTGTVIAGSGAALLLDPGFPGFQGALVVANSGVMSVATGGTLGIGGFETTAYLQSLVNTISSNGVLTVLSGSLNNAGAILPLSGLLNDVILGGTISGGTIVAASDTVTTGLNLVLVSVAYDGPLVVGNDTELSFFGGVALAGATGAGPGTLAISGSEAGVFFDDPSDVLANDVVLASGQVDSIYAAGSLTLGAASTALVTGLLTLEGNSFTNAGSIGVVGELEIETAGFSNTGTLTVASGAKLQLGLPFASFLDGPATPLAIGALGSISLAAGSTLAVGGSLTTAQLLSLLGSIGTAGVVVELDGTVVNTGAVLAVNSGTSLADVVLAGAVVGGTIVAGTGSLSIGSNAAGAISGFDTDAFDTAAFYGVTVDGPLAFGAFSQLDVTGGLSVIPATGSIGIINVTGVDAEIVAEDPETFDRILINDTSYGFSIEGQTLVFGTGMTLDVGTSGNTGTLASLQFASIEGSTFANSGTLAVFGTHSELFVGEGTFTNNGVVTVGSSDVLALSSFDGSSSSPLVVNGTGSYVFTPGATLEVGGSLTTAQLLTLLGTVVGTQQGVTVELDGTVSNTGATIASVAGGVLGNLILDGTVQNGTISTGAGSVSVAGGAFSGVTYQGPLVLGTEIDLSIRRGLVLQSANGALPGTLAVTGSFSTLSFTDSETLSNALLSIGGSGFEITAPSNGSFTLDPSLTSAITGQLVISAGTIVNGMGVALTTPGSAFELDSNTVTNSANITAAAQTVFGIGATPGALGASLPSGTETPIALTNTGVITLAAGVTLAVGGRETDAQIAALVGSLAPAAGEVILDGVVVNTGLVLTGAAIGDAGNLLFDGAAVLGGTILDSTGTVAFGGDDLLQSVTYDGALVLGGSLFTDVAVTGGLNVLSPTGGAGTVSVGGSGDALLELYGANQTLTGLVISIGTAVSTGTLVTQGEIDIDGTVTIAAGETITTGGYASLLAVSDFSSASTLVNLGRITGSNSLEIGSTSGAYSTFVNAGVITVAAGRSQGVSSGGQVFFQGSSAAPTLGLTLVGNVVNTGNIAFTGPGTLAVETSSFSNTGMVLLTGGAVMDFNEGPIAAGSIDVSAGGETIAYVPTFASGGVFSASLLRFGNGDIFDLPDIIPTGVTATLSGSTLNVTNGSSLVASLALSGPVYTQSEFTVQADANGFAEIVSTAPCFCAGTRILTETGARPVETLVAGERVLTQAGELAEIVWVGQRRVDLRRHRQPALVRPVRIRAGAFADGVPARDLLVSPDHAIFDTEAGVLVPARYLVNGATVVDEVDCERAHYFHVELAAHAVLLAEGLPAESYLDTGNRDQFADSPTPALHPDFAPRAWAEACAPLCLTGAVPTRMRRDLLARTETLGYRRQGVSDVWLAVGGRQVRALSVKGEVHSFMLPAGTHSVRLVSPAGVPAELDPEATDRRRLGVAVGGIVANGRNLPLDGAVAGDGFHASEGGWRWTGGDAGLELAAAGVRGAVILEMLIRGFGAAWVDEGCDAEVRKQSLLF